VTGILTNNKLYRLAKGLVDDVASIADASRQQLRISQELFANQLLTSPRYADRRRLAPFGAQVFSQNEEDGMIAEAIARVGCPTRVFVECGVGDGLENNTAYLLMSGWSGFWFESDKRSLGRIASVFHRETNAGTLRVASGFLTMENAADVLTRNGVPREFDVLSLDIDRNTSHLWRALRDFRPRVVVVEYNASIPASQSWEVEYDPTAVWDGSLHFGASLKRLEEIGSSLGYVLVGCNLTGANAFFVRQDLAGDLFCPPYTSENHYEPPRYFLTRTVGHPRNFR